MSGDRPRDKSRLRNLISDEDADLWGFVARSIAPAKGKSRVRDVEPTIERKIEREIGLHLSGAAPKSLPAASAKPAVREPAASSKARPAPAPLQAQTPASPLGRKPSPPEPKAVPLLRRKARRIARGAEEIEARLDLHGMTQDEAHHALIGFVLRCHSASFRTVLVITGKGAPTARDRHGDHQDDHHHDFHTRPRGVLRRNVPRWLSGAEIGALVVSYSTAHIRHGGEGALYVHLRRKA